MLRLVVDSSPLGLPGSILGTSAGKPSRTHTHNTMTNLERTLSHRFTDQSEIRDVSRHGCSGGVSGFIYSSELFEFFNEHESDIEDILDELGLKFSDLVNDQDNWTFQELREKAVWFVVEYYCQSIVEAYAVA